MRKRATRSRARDVCSTYRYALPVVSTYVCGCNNELVNVAGRQFIYW